MPATTGSDWRTELGIDAWKPPGFFSGVRDIDSAERPVPQAHALRRAFDELRLDGILCLHDAPLMYFKEVPRIELAKVTELHRRFWSQGLAPILTLISPSEVHIYSGLATPARPGEDINSGNRLAKTLDRVADAAEVRQLVLALESGEFFHSHARSFDPKHRVDRELLRNLEAARDRMAEVTQRKRDAGFLDAVLCRMIFSCYLFDRGIIGPSYIRALGSPKVDDLREILSLAYPPAKTLLYKLFAKLGEDFNGDLFQDDLDDECDRLTADHIEVLQRLIHGADVRTGQGSFWPYDFSIIPIETVSAIYDHFLRIGDPEGKKQSGAFYTRRFLAEVILDCALDGFSSLLDKRFLDPACGSGIFLVGLFNRLAEEWKRKNPAARYDKRASSLMTVLRDNLFGVDRNPTACRIAAFSLYLALLDQLSPPDIQELQRKGRMLPRIVFTPEEVRTEDSGRTILCADFFSAEKEVPGDFHLVVGNPPWASVKNATEPVVQWCNEHRLPIPDRQLAIGFVWKSPRHLTEGGRVCFVLPHGILFNHGSTALAFQREWLNRHAIDFVLNLADYQRFLFQEAEAPALVIRYLAEPHKSKRARIQYLAPKTDWSVAQAEVINVAPEDRTEIDIRDVTVDLDANRVPLVWKERFWGSPRDWKLLDRLELLPKLEQAVGQAHQQEGKRWLVAQGFQKLGPSDDASDYKVIVSPSQLLAEATARHFDLFLLESDCSTLRTPRLTVRSRSNTNTTVFQAPHVLITDGFKVAYADFDVAFRQAVRGIHGPRRDRDLLTFLAAYLRSSLARYYLFHTSGNLGVERAKVEQGELLRLPFPFPDQAPSRNRGENIVQEVAMLVRQAVSRAKQPLADRAGITQGAREKIERLLYEYFDVDEVERVLIEDTNQTLIPSMRRKRASEDIPTLRSSSDANRREYTKVLSDVLDDWARGGPYRVSAHVTASSSAGIGVVTLRREKLATGKRQSRDDASEPREELLAVLQRLQTVFKRERGTVHLLCGVKVFDGDMLYLLKPLNYRFWTRTAALNDADSIAAAILSPGR